MRRELKRATARILRRAIAASTLGLSSAIAVGAGGFVVLGTPAGTVAAMEAALPVSLPVFTSSATPGALAAVTPPSDTNSAHGPYAFAITVIPVTEQVEAEEAAAAIQAADEDDLVEATRVAALPPAPPGTLPLQPGDRVTASLSFYYCEQGTETAVRGDGGGFCGAMRNGTVVYPGAAACDYDYLGQRFRIEGDPTGHVYDCADTGSAVHGLHRDVWFHSSDDGWAWQRVVGRTATIEILP